MAAGAGAPAPRLPIGTFEISAVTLRPPSARFFLALRPLRDGWVSFERWGACRSAVSRWIPRPRQRPAGSLLMLSGRSPGSADRFARVGIRAQRVTTMRCKRRFAQARPQAKRPLMNYSNWGSNATTTSGFAGVPERSTAARELLRSGGDFFLQIGSWTRTSIKTV